MHKPNLRFFIIPLGVVCALASLAGQNAPSRAQQDIASISVRQQVVDCSSINPNDVCVISFDGETRIN